MNSEDDKKHNLDKFLDIYKLDKHEYKKTILKREDELDDLQNLPDKMIQMLKERSDEVAEELLHGLLTVKKYQKTVTFFGSARFKPGTKYYEDARELAKKVCRMGFAVITGGGPGIMEAANRGTNQECNYGIGFNIELPKEQVINPYVTHGVNFKFFSARKMAMIFSGEAYVFYPGGFGTLDELFQILTLIQTKKIPRVPVFLVGSEFYRPLDEFINYVLLKKFETISPEDRKIYKITDSHQEILEVLEKVTIQKDNEYYKS